MTYLPVFLSGFALSGALIVAIGAQNAFVLRQGLRREHVGPIVLFCSTMDTLLIAAGVAGIGSLLGEQPSLMLALSLGGAGFLAWYGISALRRALKPGALLVQADQERMSLRSTMLRLVGFTLLNPHVYLDTVLLVGAVGGAEAPAARPFFVLGAACASTSWFVLLGYGARYLSPLFARAAAWRILDGAIAATMLAICFGIVREVL